jgi:hypothetical protein
MCFFIFAFLLLSFSSYHPSLSQNLVALIIVQDLGDELRGHTTAAAVSSNGTQTQPEGQITVVNLRWLNYVAL